MERGRGEEERKTGREGREGYFERKRGERKVKVKKCSWREEEVEKTRKKGTK